MMSSRATAGRLIGVLALGCFAVACGSQIPDSVIARDVRLRCPNRTDPDYFFPAGSVPERLGWSLDNFYGLLDGRSLSCGDSSREAYRLFRLNEAFSQSEYVVSVSRSSGGWRLRGVEVVERPNRVAPR